MNAMRQAHADGWFIVFDTLTLADDRLEAFYDNPNALRDYFRDIGRMVLAADGRKANDSHADCYQYFCVPEYGTANGRLHFFFFSSRRRHTRFGCDWSSDVCSSDLVFQIVAIGTQITEAITGLERTREILNEKLEDDEPGRTVSLDRVNGMVEMQDVSFAYDTRKEVLHEVSFRSEPGTVTALVGPSGAGKSTIIGLIAAFYVPSSGRVLVDGIDLATVKLDSYRTQLGVVLQETFLFDGTIRENVAFARPTATEDEILAACHIARVDEFAESFEHKYDTVVGERGVKLSGGQKQRVSIARAILADPRILILDEATSSLDSESEALIQEGLRYLMRGRTTFVIAHRLSTIRRADEILVVEAGCIIERGTHETLYALGGRYYDLYTKQHAVEANLFLAPGEGSDLEDSTGAEIQAGATGRSDAALPDAIRIIRGQNS